MSIVASPDVSLAEKVAFLRRPSSHDHRPPTVETIETHMAWLFLAGERVLKLKKPMLTPHLDHTTLAARRRACEEEVRLGRRLAPWVYVGVVPLLRREEALALGDAAGEVVDWLVEMVRLPRDRMLDVAMSRGTVALADVDAVVDVLVAFQRDAPVVRISPRAYVGRLLREADLSRRELLQRAPDALRPAVNRVVRTLEEDLDRHRDVLARRAAEGRILDGHGDLRPEHVCLLRPPVVLDPLEFDPVLRQVDPADEVAFLALECRRLEGGAVGEALLARWRQRSGDPVGDLEIELYTRLRAVVRARLALLHLDDHEDHARWIERTARYLRLVDRVRRAPGVR